MELPHSENHVERFVLGLLRTGWMLCDLVSDLAESLPADAYPGEEPTAVVIQMLCGTVGTALDSADQREVRRATELIDEAADRTIEHLRLACELSRRLHGEDGELGRAYG